jgi:acetyl esterase/lipase
MPVLRLILSLAFAVLPARAADLVFSLADLTNAVVQSNVVFKRFEGGTLASDFYLPNGSRTNQASPAVIFVVGDASPEQLRGAKDWSFVRSYGRLAAASGWVGMTFNHRSSENFRKLFDVQSDIADALAYARRESARFSIDRDRLCLWFFSGSGPHLRVAMGTNAAFVRCLVAYYPVLAPPHGHAEFATFSSITQLRQFAPRVPPILIAKAGQDAPVLNAMIDEFRRAAESLNLPFVYFEHPTGRHAFDLFNDDKTSREIITETLAFIRERFNATGSPP